MKGNGKIKVLQAIRQGKVGGGETHVVDLVSHLNKDHFQPVVLSFTDGEMIDKLNDMHVENYVIPSEKAFDFSTWKSVKALLREKQIDLIHIHGTRATSNVYWAAKNLGLPTVYTIHGWSFHNDQNALIKNARIFFEKWITKKTDCNISVSESNKQTGEKNISGFKSVVVHNGIDLVRFNPDCCKRKNLRKELNIAEDAFVISFVGRMTAQKNPLGLIKAFKEATTENANTILLMVGDGELKEQAIALVKELGIENSVVFQKSRNDVADVLFSSDIFCLPSLWEGFPIALLEAMAMRKAVIATEVDGSVEIIQNKKNGILIKPQNVQMLAEAIKELINNNNLRKELAEAAQQTILNDFDVKKMTKKIEDVYINVLSKN
jgi:glycosyltransferase involved in cell wall biosynthesis